MSNSVPMGILLNSLGHPILLLCNRGTALWTRLLVFCLLLAFWWLMAKQTLLCDASWWRLDALSNGICFTHLSKLGWVNFDVDAEYCGLEYLLCWPISPPACLCLEFKHPKFVWAIGQSLMDWCLVYALCLVLIKSCSLAHVTVVRNVKTRNEREVKNLGPLRSSRSIVIIQINVGFIGTSPLQLTLKIQWQTSTLIRVTVEKKFQEEKLPVHLHPPEYSKRKMAGVVLIFALGCSLQCF